MGTGENIVPARIGRPPKPARTRVGRRIRSHLSRLDLTQSDLCRLTSLHTRALTDIIHRPNLYVKVQTALRLARALGTTVEELWG